jgi:hypothetical protein
MGKFFNKDLIDSLAKGDVKKDFIPGDIDVLAKSDVGKQFNVSTEFLRGSANKLLQKFGFAPPFLLDFLEDLPVGISAFGLPVFDSVEFPGGHYSIINPGLIQESIQFAGILIDTVVVQASMRKNIVKTEIAGREGAVKEYISSNDTMISISGAIINAHSMAYPRTEVQNLVRILNIPQQLRVKSKFINDILGFEFITIESWSLNTTTGTRNTQLFSIEAINDISPEIDETSAT